MTTPKLTAPAVAAWTAGLALGFATIYATATIGTVLLAGWLT